MVIGEALRSLSALLAEKGIDEADREARLILADVLGMSAAELLAAKGDSADADKAFRIAAERAKGKPLQYLLGKWEFYGLPFKVGEGVLIPRPETELLVDLAAETLGKNDLLLDLCSGSGCIPIAAAKTVGCKAVGVELYDRAYSFFKENITLNGAEELVTPIKGDALKPETLPIRGKYRLITANPPYLTAEEMENLQREVTFEPETALYGGVDGLDFYRRLFLLYKPYLAENGVIAVEVGDRQHEAVMALAKEAGLKPSFICDYGGIARVVSAGI